MIPFSCASASFVTPAPSPPVIAITLGEPAGIGPEVIVKALQDPLLPQGVKFEILTGEGKALQALSPLVLSAALEARLKSIGVVPGRSDEASARQALAALREAVAGWKEGRYAAIVTGPVQKETLALLEPGFVGQTEFFARACGLCDNDAVMVMTDPRLTVALVSTHCSLKQALQRLTPDKIVHTATQLDLFLRRRGRRSPRLALAGVNPHAGENGLFGDEEALLLAPALARLRGYGMAISGPHSPDTVFYQAADGFYDGVVCTYHDQGLIPFKLVAFHTGVNVTLGLPLIRTSPDHGTALDLAGKNRADHRSMLAALGLAADLVESGGKEA